VVNEGEYQMINTFDLTVDMLFYELRFNPWTVKNVLDQFADRYSYYDEVKHSDEHGVWYPGGISFTHDMGVHNQFTSPEFSSYERNGLTGCFSHMTHEQLNNWVLCAALYVNHTNDEHWLVRRRGVLKECFQSILNRDGRNPEEYDGVMNMDSSRCGVDGQEITTYDSLDASLGQSRNNLHVAVKTWGAYLALKVMFTRLGWIEDAEECEDAARRAAATVVSKYLPEEGFIPAVFEAGNRSAIIPAIEGLVFPYLLGDFDAVAADGRYEELIETLKKHMKTVLVPGVCVDPVGHWWKISSTSNNSWFSKVAISQFIARQILGFDFGANGVKYERAHADWQRIGSADWAMCDQIVNGVAAGSKYYPRGVSDILWLEESPATAVLTPKE
ncbi:MAG: glycoside hydrolase family 52 protein, partial [bacterium]